MSLYNDPRNFGNENGNLSSNIQTNVADAAQEQQPILPLEAIEGQLIYLSDPANYTELNFLKVVEDDAPITAQTQLSVRKVVDGFVGFGAPSEGRMVEELLKGVGAFDQSANDHVFTPNDIA